MEIWTGTTFALAAATLQAGLRAEAFQTAKGIYNMVYEDYGLWFQTPEALSALESVRAISYMRPLAIWAIQWELDRK
jgi:non-lysosomal glucosylceramidase